MPYNEILLWAPPPQTHYTLLLGFSKIVLLALKDTALTVNIEVYDAANQGVKSNAEISTQAHYTPEQKYKRLNHSRLFSAHGPTSTHQKCFLLTMPLMDDYWAS